MLVVFNDYRPFIFDDTRGNAALVEGVGVDVLAFKIDETRVDAEYLVHELNKEYFVNLFSNISYTYYYHFFQLPQRNDHDQQIHY